MKLSQNTLRRRVIALLLLPLTLAATSCSEVTAPPAPAASVAPPNTIDPSLLGGLIGGVTDVLGSLTGSLLSCNVSTTSTASKTIGPAGGYLIVGPHKLVVPPRALDRDVTITATAPAGKIVAVEFQPHGLEFDLPTALTMSYSQCGLLSTPRLKIVYIDGDRKILEVLPSLQNLLLRNVTGKVDHFSQYALAY